jgi:tellurite resistance protein TerC
MISDRLILWIAFNIFILGILAIDLGVFHRTAHKVSLREASVWSVVWVSLAMFFNLAIYYLWGAEKALEFLAGYLIEKSLSVDNIFVFLMIFSYFAVPAVYQHRVLFWGILGALIMRAIFIAAGTALLNAFDWAIYFFGGFLIVTGVKMLLAGDQKLEPEKNPAVRLLRHVMQVSEKYHGQSFFVRLNGRLWATPLLVVLVVVETTDVIFAVDSIPAIFAVTQDPFIVYTSNVFAILGLRAMYFLLAGIMEMFCYLRVGLSFVLCFVGAKMLLVDFYKIPIGMSLGVVASILILSVLASLLPQRKLGRAKTLMSKMPASFRKWILPNDLRRQIQAWVCVTVVFATLAIVKWASIQTGPSAAKAIVAIRLAQHELAQAHWTDRKTPSSNLKEAEDALNRAWSLLEDQRYEAAIVSAHKVVDFSRNLEE